MKKKITALAAAALTMAALTMSVHASDGGTLTIMLNGTASDAQIEGYKNIIEEFNETNEYGVTVESNFYSNSDYKTALSTMMASDSEPDIIFSWELGFLGNYVNGGKIISLQPYLDEDPDWASIFNSGVLDLLTYNGEVYGIPTQQCVGVMYYNTRIFEENGLSVPTTWEEFENVCAALKENGVTPMSLASTAADAWLVSQFIQEISNGIGGYELFDSLYQGEGVWNDEDFVQAAGLFQDLVNAGYFEDGFTGVSGDEAREFFRMGMTAMYFNGSWEAASVSDPSLSAEAENIGCFILPKYDSANDGVTIGSVDTSFAITKNCENVDAAVAFLKFWTTEENTSMLAYDYGRVPCTNYELDESRLTPLMASLIEQMAEQTNMTPWFDRVDADLGNEFNNQCVSIANGDDPQTCFDSLQAYAESRG